jgi:ADP-ribosylglycohydrolase
MVMQLLLVSILSFSAIWMGPKSSKNTTEKGTHASTVNFDPTMRRSSSLVLTTESRLRAALWGYFAGDALASPSHWYYGGFPQIKRDYGKIEDYTQPVYELTGSILNKSNLNGGGRRKATSKDQPQSIIGYVINHGKQDLWSPSKSIHYHATLQKGENTLEVQLARVLMKSIVASQGVFNPDHFREAYIKFMMTAGSHNDTYASTCHRMFFANLVYGKLPPKDCPDDDGHNVETIDGLVLPTIVALAVGARSNGTLAQAADMASACADVTRKSNVLHQAAGAWGKLVFQSVQPSTLDMKSTLQETAASLGFRKPNGNGRDELTACYLGSAMPALLDSLAKYNPNPDSKSSTWHALLANANTGGENVHRGSCLGAVLGSQEGLERMETVSPQLMTGLHDFESLRVEIDDFVAAVTTSAKATSLK